MKRYEFIQEQAEEHPVKALCEVMRIRRSSYYAWRQSKSRERATADEMIKRMIEPVFRESRQTYGARRLTACLKKVGINTSRRRVCRLMKARGNGAKTSGEMA